MAPTCPPNAVPPEAEERAEIAAPVSIPAPPALSSLDIKKSEIDIHKIVHKLEEAAKEQHRSPNKFISNRTYSNNSKQKFSPRKNNRFTITNHGRSPQNQGRPQQHHNGVAAATQYSDLVKKRLPPQYNIERAEKQKEHTKKVDVRDSPSKSVRKPNQWISVSNRKRRKNKMVDDEEFEEEPEAQTAPQPPDDAFEPYDISQLVDVVVPSLNDIKLVEEGKEEAIEVTIQETVATAEHLQQLPESVDHKHAYHDPVSGVDDKTKSATPELEKEGVAEEIENAPEEHETVTEDTEEPNKRRKSRKTATQKKIAIINEEEEEKKQKKKRKKQPKKLLSTSSSTTTLSQFDDSYEFLLENSKIEDFEEKTNIEISQELDKIIQRGMYNSLEEKIRSMNINPELDEKFFNSIELNSLGQQKPATIKATGFGEHLHVTSQLVKRPDEQPQPSTSKAGIFLENPVVNALIRTTTATEPTRSITASKNRGLKSKSKHKSLPIEMVTNEHKPSYPITQAVKDWMVKTKESTPDIKLLKSPNTILKEFCETEPEQAEAVPKNVQSNPLPPPPETEGGTRVANDNEVTFSSFEEDLLDCWENEVTPPLTNSADALTITTNGFVEEGEDVVEVYESRYGKNEDYLRLKAEVEEATKKNSANFPKHGNLPYRAICCSIM